MSDREALQRCLLAGGVAIFPADTVYGLACDPNNREAVHRLYALKGRDATRLGDVPPEIRSAVDLAIDGGSLPGTPSTVIDVRTYEKSGDWSVIREGALHTQTVAEVLDWDPARYAAEIRADIPDYERLQDELVKASGNDVRSMLELGTGTGETARRLLARHPQAHLTGIDASLRMLAAAAASLPDERVSLKVGRLQDPLPEGPFDLVASALCVHHLQARAKADLFAQVAGVLVAGGRFVLADVVVPPD